MGNYLEECSRTVAVTRWFTISIPHFSGYR